VQHRSHFIGRQVDVGITIVTDDKPMTIAVALNQTLNFCQQGAGLLNIFDILPFFPEMPRWRNW
jgi:hypothetical protein